jgi:hypothetical protein
MNKYYFWGLAALAVIPPVACIPVVHTHRASYSTVLVEVHRPAETKDRWGDVEEIELGDSAKYSYTDDLVNVVIAASEETVEFIIQNQTDHTIRLSWDDAAFIDPAGSASRVMHVGIR